MRFAQWVYRLAGIYGLLVLFPQYFIYDQFGIDHPPAITHPEFYYGFVGVGLAWQVAFLIIGQDPIRYRPLMIATWLEKFTFAGAALVLFLQQRIPQVIAGAAAFDCLLGVLFVVAWWKTPRE